MTVTGPSIGCRVAASLDGWTRHEWSDGLQLEHLRELDELSIRTCNSVYRFVVIAPGSGDILVQGGRFFPEPTRARLAGCSMGGAFLKQRGVYVGFRLEIQRGLERIVTSDVRSIEVVPGKLVH